MTTVSVVGECFFWYRLTRVVPDNFHRAVKRLCVCMCCHMHTLQLLQVQDSTFCNRMHNKPVSKLLLRCRRFSHYALTLIGSHTYSVRAFCFGHRVCLSVPRQISETTRYTHEISSPLKEIGVGEQEYDVRFCVGGS